MLTLASTQYLGLAARAYQRDGSEVFVFVNHKKNKMVLKVCCSSLSQWSLLY